MADPVSWKVIEHGWTVVDANGEEVGKVHEVVGDPNADIFSGLVIHRGLRAKQDVPSEIVGDIVEGQVNLTVAKGALDSGP
jgi:rRNA processing protein Gar1